MDSKTILVVGASGAIGLGIIAACEAVGYRVVACSRSRPEVSPAGGWIPLDVRDEGSVKLELSRLADEVNIFGMVYCAAITADAPLVRMSTEQWSNVLSTNLTGAFFVTRAIAENMMMSGNGRLIFIGSIASRIGVKGQSNYVSSKSAIEGFSRTLSEELGPFGITSNVIASGPVDSPMFAKTRETRRRMLEDHIPLRRLAGVSDVANTVTFLLSDGAAYINGQTIAVDGGLHKI